ncbi:MAG: hypothetical protein J1D77_06480 [Muribaculaceae bacterium]|nr:hypothetical protein [Muribaculaceae bacterium]
MNDKIRKLIDKVYELEGLLHLSLKREDASGDFLRLIAKKGREVGALCESLPGEEKGRGAVDNSEETEAGSPSAFSLDEYSIDEENEEENKAEKTGGRGKLVFSINERFRFKKELFRNSDADFNTTLALVASMDSYDEAESFFLDEEGFDKNQPAVREFLEIIKKYFK